MQNLRGKRQESLCDVRGLSPRRRHLAAWLPVPPGMQSALIDDAPQTYFEPPYVGSSGWIGIELEQITDEALAIHIREACQLVAPKKKKKH